MNLIRNCARAGAAIVATAILAACAGGTNAGIDGSSITPNVQASNAAFDTSKKKQGANITIRIPRKQKRARRRLHPLYIPQTAQSMTVTVPGGKVLAQTFNLTPGSSGCTTTDNYVTCSETAFFRSGKQTISITLYDQLNGVGHALSTASQRVKIAAGAITNISIVLNGVPATATVFLNGDLTFDVTQGTPVSVAVSVTAEDADGNIIMAPGNYSTPITLTDSDTNSTTLSGTSVTTPGQGLTLSYNGGSGSAATITPSIGGKAQPSGAATLTIGGVQKATILEYSLSSTSGLPSGITAGPDGALWFTDYGNSRINRITTDGTQTTPATAPSAGTCGPGFQGNGLPGPGGIATGPDGNLWFTEFYCNAIGMTTPGGSATAYALTETSDLELTDITAGSDGALWFTEPLGGSISDFVIGRITTTGTITEYSLPNDPGAIAQPSGITKGPDGALWFTELDADEIGRLTTDGLTFTEYSVPTANVDGQENLSGSITAGPDGALWFTEFVGNKIARITTSGSITEYDVPTSNSEPSGIAAGADGALWFTEFAGNNIGRITTGGNITEYSLPVFGTVTLNGQSVPAVGPKAIVAGPSGTQSLWFLEPAKALQGSTIPPAQVGVVLLPGSPLARHRTQPIVR